MDAYNAIYDWYCAARNPEAGVEVVRAFAKHMKAGGAVLDLGCGRGDPVASTLSDLGFELYGIDSSIKMIEGYRERFPEAQVECEDVLASDFFNRSYDAVVSYGFMFHLPQSQQIEVLAKISQHLDVGGYCLFNSGDEDGDKLAPADCNGGIRMMFYSMTSTQYKEALLKHGMELVKQYVEEGFGSTIYIARKL